MDGTNAIKVHGNIKSGREISLSFGCPSEGRKLPPASFPRMEIPDVKTFAAANHIFNKTLT
jgi:hypothetical protein